MTLTFRTGALDDWRRRAGAALARESAAKSIDTVVPASHVDGLRFAEKHGFVEVDRYVLPGDTVAFVDLRRAPPSG